MANLDWRRWPWCWPRCPAEARWPSRDSWSGGCDGRRAMTVTGVVSAVLLVAGLVVVVGSCAGMAVFDDPLDRLHLTTPAAMLGSTGICAAVVVRVGLSASGLAAIGVAVILIAANPLVGHAVARAIAIRRGATWTDPQDESAGSPGEEQ